MFLVRAALAATALALTSAAWAQGSYEDERTPAGWAWARIRSDEIADFGAHCGELDPHSKEGWDHACRQIPPQFLVNVLTVPKWRNEVLRHRVRLRGSASMARSTSPMLKSISKASGILLLHQA